ncbi:MAG: DUF2828 family protein [Ignavibacteria bacterium]|jgi:hypothetical protein|nr:DUF2828 family protein [Ignavibacteria bacterium]
MFNNKKITLSKYASYFDTNSFIDEGLKITARILSGNGAEKFSTSGNPFVDQFNMLSLYRKPRKYNKIAKDCELLWSTDKELCVKFIFWLRIITRVTIYMDNRKTTESQKGGELRWESIYRLIWLYQKEANIFYRNLHLFVAVGSWKDIFLMLRYDLIYNGVSDKVLDTDFLLDFILIGLQDDSQSELVKKYLPQIKSYKKCKTVEAEANTIIAKQLAKKIGCSYEDYRKIKSSGKAHTWQKLISKKLMDRIDFNTIHGRALYLLIKGKFLDNQGLREKYLEWVKSPDVDSIKFTGFVHELFSNLPSNEVELDETRTITINKQFKALVEKAGETEQTKLIVVRDTSGSMEGRAVGTNMSSGDIAKALALYFSEFLTGEFSDAWIEFESKAKMHKWIGDTPVARWYNDHSSYIGSTNFQNVIDLFCKLKADGIPETDFPIGILCISDGEFDPADLGKTNVETAREKLKKAGFSEEYTNNFKIILWNIANWYYGKAQPKFETYADVSNVFYLSGYSASIVSFIVGGDAPLTGYELFLSAMNQEILNQIKINESLTSFTPAQRKIIEEIMRERRQMFINLSKK